MEYQQALPPGAGPCRKQIVVARVETAQGDAYEASNYCLRPQATCPRQGMPSGQGYELCRDVCGQPGHAEANALALAGERARGATLTVRGHHYACGSCRAAALRAGIARLVVSGQESPLGDDQGGRT